MENLIYSERWADDPAKDFILGIAYPNTIYSTASPNTLKSDQPIRWIDLHGWKSAELTFEESRWLEEYFNLTRLPILTPGSNNFYQTSYRLKTGSDHSTHSLEIHWHGDPPALVWKPLLELSVFLRELRLKYIENFVTPPPWPTKRQKNLGN